jgi:hypothetical protein
MNKYKLSQATIERLGYYVYLLIDPRNNRIFYVGKGKGNRINQHLLVALNNHTHETKKINKIRDIQNAGLEVKLDILRHGLNEDVAFEIESSIIDTIGKENLTNSVLGQDSEDRGRMNLEELKIKYEAHEAAINDPMILINLNNQFRRGMSEKKLYESTRKSWRINIKRATKYKLACAVYRGIIREVYSIHPAWLPAPNSKTRHMFQGKVAPAQIRDKYVNKSVSKYWKKGSQNPIKYVQ